MAAADHRCPPCLLLQALVWCLAGEGAGLLARFTSCKTAWLAWLLSCLLCVLHCITHTCPCASIPWSSTYNGEFEDVAAFDAMCSGAYECCCGTV